MAEISNIAPQPGFQTEFLSTSADIAIGGSGAGVGKTFALLLEPLRHHENSGFGAVYFRRTSPQITNTGGLWDESKVLYHLLAAHPRENSLEWEFSSGATVKFRHLQHEKNIYDHQGGQYPLIGFDELTHFTSRMFFYLLSRNRSTCGVRPYVRATCNPDPDSWVANFIEWWIDQEEKLPNGEDNPNYGYPIRERIGKLRYFTRYKDNLIWGDTKHEVIDKAPHLKENPALRSDDLDNYIKSVTFIDGNIYDNKELLSKDPGYLANLLAQDEDEKMRLLFGNWKIRTDGLSLMQYSAINNIFDNYATASAFKCITCDAARFGRDLCVIKAWQGFEVVFIVVMSISEAQDIVKAIEELRRKFQIQKTHVLVDQDGVGGGTVQLGGYVGFSGGAPAKIDPKDLKNPSPEKRKPENYKNLKTQCAYRFAERVNAGEVRLSVTDENVIVNGARGTKVKYGAKLIDVRDLIKADLRSFKRKDPDAEGKKQMIDKAEQKTMLNGRSPDFGDTLIMREYFELVVTEKNYIKRIN